MERPLLKRSSSISQRVHEERNDTQPLPLTQYDRADQISKAAAPHRTSLQQSFDQEGDTDTSSVSDSDAELQPDKKQSQRVSSRIMSMKRRGKLEQYQSTKFLYFANDYLAVRGDGRDFFLCKVLEDVPESTEFFQITWLDQINKGKKLFKISYDDICYTATVIDRVSLMKDENGLLHLSAKHLKQVKLLLREALQNENIEHSATESSDDDNEEEPCELEVDEEELEEEHYSDDGVPPKKKRKKSNKLAEKGNRASKQEKTKEKGKSIKRRGLMPNPDIKVVDKDPLFEEKNDLPIANVKRGLQAVLQNDMQSLNDAIRDVENVYTVFWDRSADIKLGPMHYALLTENKKAVDLLMDENQPKQRKAKAPTVSLSKMNTGRYNFYTFGHGVRELEASRGAKEGDNAFLKERSSHTNVDMKFCLKYVSLEMINYYYNTQDYSTIMSEIGSAIRNGRRSIAAYFLKKVAEKDDLQSYGFNFLHKEVLANDSEALSKFRVQSVTKKSYMGNVLPLHCAAINPNVKYLQALYSQVPDCHVKDSRGRKLIHYAAACEGPGPLAFLMARGADPNDVDLKGTTPLMIAAKLGRCENVDELLKAVIEVECEDNDMAEYEEARPTSNGSRPCVNVNAKGRKTAKAAIHYAAKNGHESTVRMLVQHGAIIDIQAGASKGNMTALAMAAEQGHLDLVKALVELGAAPDGKVRHKKTPLVFAAQNGHYKVMAYLLNIGVDPNGQDSSSNTPIHYAAAYGWYHCVRLLLDAGADPNVANIWKTTPLAIALLKDNIHCADLLLSRNVNVDIPDDKGATVLMNQLALDFDDGSFEKIRFLVEEKGANVNLVDMKESSTLHYLASNSVFKKRQQWSRSRRKAVTFDKTRSDICNKIAHVLLKAGADLNSVNEDGYTPSMIALLQNNFPLVELLVQKGADLNVIRSGSTVKPMLHVLLSKTERLDLIELFSDPLQLASLEDMTEDQFNEIYETQNEEIEEKFFNLFLDFGANLCATSEDGKTPLMLAIEKGSVTKSEKLLLNGADPRIGENSLGQNVFHVLASACTGADWSSFASSAAEKFGPMSDLMNRPDNDGFTPVLLAFEALASCKSKKNAVQNFKNFIKILVDRCRANFGVHVVEKRPCSEEESAQKHRIVPTFGFLVEEAKKIESDPYPITGKFTCLHFLAMVHLEASDQADLVGLIIKSSSYELLNRRCRHGRTPLHVAIKFRNADAAVSLIRAGCDVTLESLNYEQDCLLVPMSLAARPTGQLDIVKELLQFNANSNAKSGKDERTPLSYAVENVSGSTSVRQEVLDLVTSLVGAGAHLNSLDVNKRTPLHHLVNATSGGYEALIDVEEFLVASGADVSAIDGSLKMPIFYAFSSFNRRDDDDIDQTNLIDPISIVRLLCHHAEKKSSLASMLSHKDNKQRTIMHYAALRGASISCLHMLKHGALTNQVDIDGNTPVALALRSGHHGCAMLLLQHCSTLTTWDVMTPVTKQQLKQYTETIQKSKWRFASNCNIEKPKAVKKSALQISIEKDWPGIAYLILEYGKIPLFEAFRASLKAGNLSLSWTLLNQERNPQAFSSVDDNDSNLLHVLASHSNLDEDGDGMLIQIAKFLIHKGVDVAKGDKDRMIPLHIAAYNVHFPLCELLLDSCGDPINPASVDGLTPIAAIFSSAVNSGEITKKHVKLIKYFVSKGINSFDVCYATGAVDSEGTGNTTTIMNDLIQLENDGNFADSGKKQGPIEYLLDNGADINFADRNGITPLMTAVMLNHPSMVKLLLSYKQINLDLVAKDGSSLAHICLSSKDGFYAERTEIFKMLLDKGMGVELLDGSGKSPLHYAMRQPTGVMAKLFSAQLKQGVTSESVEEKDIFPFKSTAVEYMKGTQLHVRRDAEEELKKLKEVHIADKAPLVDKALNMEKTGAVYADEDTGVFYDVVLTKVDLRRGVYGLNVFYKLQVVFHKGKKLWLLFNRWGRIGSVGQHQQTPFANPQDACDEFRKIFKSKTGNKWDDLSSFQKMPNKYSLVKNEKNPERMLHRTAEILKPFDLKKCPESSLPTELQDLLKNLVDLCAYTRWLNNSCKVDSNFLPFGYISHEVIEKARSILTEIRDVLKSKDNSQEHDINTYEQIAELSNSLFMMVPPAHYAYERIRPVNSIEEVEEFLEMLNMLTELSTARELLLAAQHNKQDISPLDYVFLGVGIDCEILESSSTESQYILDFLEHSCNDTVSVAGIYRLRREQEKNNFENCGIKHNRQLLWHGTETAHVISILKNGLQIEGMQAMKTGDSLGRGVYFSLSFEKSMSYSSYGGNDCTTPGFIFLCEVALGDIEMVKLHHWNDSDDDDDDVDAKMYHSRALNCDELPDPKNEVFTPYGAKLSLGRWKKNPDAKDSWGYTHHECVVKDERQIKLRYLVMLQ